MKKAIIENAIKKMAEEMRYGIEAKLTIEEIEAAKGFQNAHKSEYYFSVLQN